MLSKHGERQGPRGQKKSLLAVTVKYAKINDLFKQYAARDDDDVSC